MLGAVSLPRPLDAGLFVRIEDLIGIAFFWSDFPGFLADPLLSAVGAKTDTTAARLDEFSALEVDLRAMPFQGPFFVGSSFGRQSVKGAVTESTLFGPQTATIDATTWFATPRFGWVWPLDRGFVVGFDLGVQLKLTGNANVTLPPSASPSVRKNAQDVANVGTSYPLPSLHLRLGWML